MPPKTTQINNRTAIIGSATERSTGVLLVQCDDTLSALELLAGFFSERNVIVARHEKITCDNRLFSRFEWSISSVTQEWEDQDAFSVDFQPLAKQLNAQFSVRFMSQPQSVGLFVSTKAHVVLDVLNKCQNSSFPSIDLRFIVGSDQQMQQVADRHGVPFFFIATDGNALAYEKQQLEIVSRYKPDYIGLAHYKNILSANFIKQVNCPIINVHHGFLSSLHNVKSNQMAYENGVKLVGATARFVTPELDQGPIIEQNVRTIQSACCAEEIAQASQMIEQQVFSDALLKVLEHKVIVYKNRTIIFN